MICETRNRGGSVDYSQVGEAGYGNLGGFSLRVLLLDRPRQHDRSGARDVGEESADETKSIEPLLVNGCVSAGIERRCNRG